MIKSIRRVININGRKTSVRLNYLEWDIFDLICDLDNIRKRELITVIANHQIYQSGLTNAVRAVIAMYGKKALLRQLKNKKLPSDKSSFSNLFKILNDIIQN